MGSFLNVVIYRTIHGGSPFEGRSKCPHCKRTIAFRHNIPLLSFLLLRGRCAYCKAEISWQYPFVEFLGGILFVWWFVIGRGFFFLVQQPFDFLQPAFWLVVGLVLLSIFVIDQLYMVIPDFLNAFLFVIVLLYRIGLVLANQMQPNDFVSSLVAGFLLTGFFGGLWLITRRRGFGLGDVKLAPALGLLLGVERLIVAVFLSFIFGALVGSGLLMFKQRKLGQAIPFGPFLVLGTVASLLWGMQLWNWYWGMVL